MNDEEDIGLASASPAGSGEHVVREGESVASIAYRAGHFADTLWKDPANAQLVAARTDPEMLIVGDRISVPPIRTKRVDRAIDAKHKFRRRGVPMHLRVCVMDDLEQPLVDVPWQVRVGEVVRSGKTDAGGFVETTIPPAETQGELLVGDSAERYALHLGALPPPDTRQGFMARLQAIGYPVEDDLVAAIHQFQRESDLEETGRADEATQQALLALFGT